MPRKINAGASSEPTLRTVQAGASRSATACGGSCSDSSDSARVTSVADTPILPTHIGWLSSYRLGRAFLHVAGATRAAETIRPLG
jgi:hypothetical protein